jgi:hypothetical protein
MDFLDTLTHNVGTGVYQPLNGHLVDLAGKDDVDSLGQRWRGLRAHRFSFRNILSLFRFWSSSVLMQLANVPEGLHLHGIVA